MSARAGLREFSIDDRSSIPSTPGVYSFHDHRGAILYIGKSVSLKQRVASYFHVRGEGGDERIRRMVFNARTITIRETGSELSALLLEDRLIKRHRPPYNKRQKEYLKNRYLLLGGGPYPFVADVESPDGHDPSNLFGPFRDRHFVENLIDVIQSAFGIRSCADREPTMRCANHEIGRCRGPCRGVVSASDYARTVEEVRRFLGGREDEIVARLGPAMASRARRLDFENAAAIRDRITFCRNFCRRQRFVERFKTGVIVVQERDPACFHLFLRGVHHERADSVTGIELASLAAGIERVESGRFEDVRFVTDRAHIVYGWLKAARESLIFPTSI